MKKFTRTMLGVTLLEIMLVLAVAAMVIVMSVRYYQSANASREATSVFQQMQAVAAAADSLSQGAGSYSGVTTSNIKPLLSNVGGLDTPWAANAISIAGTKTTYTVTIASVPATVCGLIWGRLQGDNHYSSVTACNASGPTTFKYTYTANP